MSASVDMVVSCKSPVENRYEAMVYFVRRESSSDVEIKLLDAFQEMWCELLKTVKPQLLERGINLEINSIALEWKSIQCDDQEVKI